MAHIVMKVCGITLLLFILNTTALPRDISVVKVEPVIQVHENTDSKELKAEMIRPEMSINEVRIPGRISCDYEEPTEDPICQEHCFPKGYKYGICTSGVCSCV